MSVIGLEFGWTPTLRAYVVFSLARRYLDVPGIYDPLVDCSMDIATVKRVVAAFEDPGGEALDAFHDVVDSVLKRAVKIPSNRFVCTLKIDGYVGHEGDYDQRVSFDLVPFGRLVDPFAYVSEAAAQHAAALASVAETRRVALAAGEAAIADLAAEILG